jgi:hypothetical protein
LLTQIKVYIIAQFDLSNKTLNYLIGSVGHR